MSSPFLGEIRMFCGNFAPRQWALCNGQILPISQNTALFSLLGTTYGGNGSSNFALPDLQGRAPLHRGQGPGLSSYVLGQSGGSATVTLLTSEIPSHLHTARGDVAGGGTAAPSAGANWTSVGRGRPAPYGTVTSLVAMSPTALLPTGGSAPHNNLSPYLTVNFIIAQAGIYPSRS